MPPHLRGAPGACLPGLPGFLIGLGLKEYRKGTASEPEQKEAPDIENILPEKLPEEEGREAALHLFDINPSSLPDLFRKFDEAMKPPEEKPRGLRLIHAGE
jgi:hypothetical protein